MKVEGQGKGGPDGMNVDTAEPISCSGTGWVHLLHENGNFNGRINMQEKSTNS